MSEQGYILSSIKEKFADFGYKDDKSFGSALSRMKKKGEIFEENGKIFVNNDFEEKE